MPAGLTPTAVVNQAINLIGDNQSLVTGTLPNFDTSPAGVAASLLYTPTVQAVARGYGWDFNRNIATLALSGNVAPLEWTFEYIYPASGLEVRQVMPSVLVDANNPIPVRWDIGYVSVGGTLTKVIWTNVANAIAKITGQPPETLWDAGFEMTVVRLLASGMAMALAGKPETAKLMLESAGDFERAAEMRLG